MSRKTERKKQAYHYGLHAEKIAAVFLIGKFYRIRAMRYRNAHGEIDIVASRGNTLVAVEVKARRTLKECDETVTVWKQQKIARAMEGLLAAEIAGREGARTRNIRFDVIWVAPWRWPVHIKDAWRV